MTVFVLISPLNETFLINSFFRFERVLMTSSSIICFGSLLGLNEDFVSSMGCESDYEASFKVYDGVGCLISFIKPSNSKTTGTISWGVLSSSAAGYIANRTC
jgi:hypothetical protein